MKVYLYDAENGLFEGETFEAPKMLQYEEGVTPVPPPEYEHGHVPVFDRNRNEWEVICARPVSSFRFICPPVNSSKPLQAFALLHNTYTFNKTYTNSI